jgi:hypothetical protein
MLQRVFSGAVNSEEYSAAHNAAFSLARLYGHVTDKATLEVIRRPSRDPDAPAEQALGAWVQGLGGEPLEGSFARVSDAPATPLGHEPLPNPNGFNALAGPEPLGPAGPEPSGPLVSTELSNDFNDLDWIAPDWIARDLIAPDGGVPGRPENGAPSRAVTGTPYASGRTKPLRPGAHTIPPPKKRVPPPKRRVPVKKRVLTPRIPSAKDLFG